MSPLIRQLHRWTSIAFTIVSASIFIALALGRQPAQWLYYTPLLPLALLVLTGLYMFVLPYTHRRSRTLAAADREARRA